MQAPSLKGLDLSEEELQTVKLFMDNTPSVVNIANIGAFSVHNTDHYIITRLYHNTHLQGLQVGYCPGNLHWMHEMHVFLIPHVVYSAALGADFAFHQKRLHCYQAAHYQCQQNNLTKASAATVRLIMTNDCFILCTSAAERTNFRTMDTMQVPQGTGSGFIWDTKGHVVTNFHVIRGASDIKVALIDSSVYPAKARFQFHNPLYI